MSYVLAAFGATKPTPAQMAEYTHADSDGYLVWKPEIVPQIAIKLASLVCYEEMTLTTSGSRHYSFAPVEPGWHESKGCESGPKDDYLAGKKIIITASAIFPYTGTVRIITFPSTYKGQISLSEPWAWVPPGVSLDPPLISVLEDNSPEGSSSKSNWILPVGLAAGGLVLVVGAYYFLRLR